MKQVKCVQSQDRRLVFNCDGARASVSLHKKWHSVVGFVAGSVDSIDAVWACYIHGRSAEILSDMIGSQLGFFTKPDETLFILGLQLLDHANR